MTVYVNVYVFFVFYYLLQFSLTGKVVPPTPHRVLAFNYVNALTELRVTLYANNKITTYGVVRMWGCIL